MRSPLVKHHAWLGLVVFAFAVAGFLWLAGRLGGSRNRGLPAGKGQEETVRATPAQRTGLARAAATVACLGILPVLAYGTDLSFGHRLSGVVIEWPGAPAGWQGPQPVSSSDWKPVFPGATAQAMRRYLDARGRPIDVFAVAYRTQTQRAKLLGYGNTLLGGAQQQSERIVDASTGLWRETLVVDPGGTRSLIWSRYAIGRKVFVGSRVAQLWYGLAALATRPVSSLTAARVVCSPDCMAARGRLSAAAVLEPVVRP